MGRKIEFACDNGDWSELRINGIQDRFIDNFSVSPNELREMVSKCNRYIVSNSLIDSLINTDVDEEILKDLFWNNPIERDFLIKTQSIKAYLLFDGIKDPNEYIKSKPEIINIWQNSLIDHWIVLYDYSGLIKANGDICNIFMADIIFDRYQNVFGMTISSGFGLDEYPIIKTLLLYINSSNADIILGQNSKEYRDAVRAMKRFPPGHKKRQRAYETMIALKNTKILGSRITYINRHEKQDGEKTGSHASPSPHWRRGHYRRQHFGKENSEQKIIYIAPTGVCMPDFENKGKVYKVV